MFNLDLYEAFSELDALMEDQLSAEEKELQAIINAGMPVLDYIPEFVKDDCNITMTEDGEYPDRWQTSNSLTQHFRDHVQQKWDNSLFDDMGGPLFPREWCPTEHEYEKKAIDLARAKNFGILGNGDKVCAFVCQESVKDSYWQRGQSVAKYSNGDRRIDKQSPWVFCKCRFNEKAVKGFTINPFKDSAHIPIEYVIFTYGKNGSLNIKTYMLKFKYKIDNELDTITKHAYNDDKDVGIRAQSRFANDMDVFTLGQGTRNARCLCLSLIKADSSNKIGVRFFCANSPSAVQKYYTTHKTAFLACIATGNTFNKLTGDWISSRDVKKQGTASELYRLANDSRYYANSDVQRIRDRIACEITKEQYQNENIIKDQEVNDFINQALDKGEREWWYNNKLKPENEQQPFYKLYEDDYTFDYFGAKQ